MVFYHSSWNSNTEIGTKNEVLLWQVWAYFGKNCELLNFRLEKPLSVLGSMNQYRNLEVNAKNSPDDGGVICKISEGILWVLKRLYQDHLWDILNLKPPMWYLCFTGTINAYHLGLRNQLWLRRNQHHRGKICEVFPQDQRTDTLIRRMGSMLYLVLTTELGNLQEFPRWCWFLSH